MRIVHVVLRINRTEGWGKGDTYSVDLLGVKSSDRKAVMLCFDQLPGESKGKSLEMAFDPDVAWEYPGVTMPKEDIDRVVRYRSGGIDPIDFLIVRMKA